MYDHTQAFLYPYLFHQCASITIYQISKAAAQFKMAKAAARLDADTRPTRWEDVVVRPVPLQEGEEGSVELAAEPTEAPPIPDPLGISDVDLRITQELYASGRLFKASNGTFARRSTAFVGPGGSPSKSTFGRDGFGLKSSVNNANNNNNSSDSSDSDSSDESVGASNGRSDNGGGATSMRGGYRGSRTTK